MVFAIRKYMQPVAASVKSRIRILVSDVQKDYQIDMGIIMGGFSFCKNLVSSVQDEFYNDFKISSFGNMSSLAIVMGATMLERYNLKKQIP